MATEVPMCPRCQKPMEAGYVLGQTYLGNTPATIAWLPASMGLTDRGLVNEMEAEPLFPLGLISSEVLLRIPRFPGWRCVGCKLAQLSWGEATMNPPPEAIRRDLGPFV